MATLDIRTYGNLGTDTFPVSGTLSGYILTYPAPSPTHTLRSRRLVEDVVSTAIGEPTVFLTALPTLLTLPDNGAQAIVTGGVYDSLIFENVGGVITYRNQAGYPIRSTVMSLVDADLVATALGIGEKILYVLTDLDGAFSPGIVELSAVDNGLGAAVSVQRSIPFGPSYNSSTTAGLTPVSGWISQVGVGLPDRDVELGTLQDVQRVLQTLINDLLTAGVITI